MKYVKAFEREARLELGVERGMPWTLRDWRKKQYWGPYRTLMRTADADIAVYLLLREGKAEEALCQLTRNLRSKVECALRGGDWTAAWPLTGLPDPVERRKFGGTETDMVAVSGLLRAQVDLDKSVAELKSGRGFASRPQVEEEAAPAGDEDEAQLSAKAKGRAAKAKAKAKG